MIKFSLLLQILQFKLFNLCINNMHITIFIIHTYCIFVYLYLHHDLEEVQRDLHALQHKLKSMLCRDCYQFLNQHPYMKMERVELGWSCILRLLEQYIVLLYVYQVIISLIIAVLLQYCIILTCRWIQLIILRRKIGSLLSTGSLLLLARLLLR